MPETSCGVLHIDIASAIEHAERNLGFWRQPAEEYRGTLKSNAGIVVGYQVGTRRRWRLDFDPRHGNWVHVNEEDFTVSKAQQKVIHRVDSISYHQVDLYYRKWTSQHGLPR
jgi:hypothetical protein